MEQFDGDEEDSKAELIERFNELSLEIRIVLVVLFINLVLAGSTVAAAKTLAMIQFSELFLKTQETSFTVQEGSFLDELISNN